MSYFYKPVVFLVCLCLFFHQLTYSQVNPPLTTANGSPFFKQITQKTSLSAKGTDVIKENMVLTSDDRLVPLGVQQEGEGLSHQKFQQYFKGIKVEHGVYKVHARNGVAEAISGEHYKIPETLKLKPSLSEAQALQRALAFVGAKTYKWQVTSEEAWIKKLNNDTTATYFPEGELLLCKHPNRDQLKTESGGVALAYKFDIYAHEPISRAHVYIDAHSGEVILQDAIIKHIDGTADTRFSGQRTISTTVNNNVYQLRDVSRGSGIETYNMQRGTNYGSAVDFTDNDNHWTSAEHANSFKDDAALDCHLGAIKTYDYFRNVHGRNSFDGNGAAIRCYVHFAENYVNAFWNGSVMTFGDGEMNGSAGIQPLTTLDITAHEIGHAICQYTADLVYSYESGAMNEGFSDIWGAVVEHYVDPAKSIWTLGEDANFTIRSMSNPNAFEHPDTYLGQYWYTGSGDNGGVHYNSGVLNHWFYLLSIGKTGVNDNGDSYAVTGIGIDKAARIAYRTETVYLTANSQYSDARMYSIQAAKDLYGATSQEAIQTTNAWYAVGVYDNQSTPSDLTATAVSGTQINLSWTDNSTVETGFIVERSTAAASGFTQIATLAAGITSYANTGLVTDTRYYYRVKAILGTTHSMYSNVASVIVGTPPIVMTSGSQITCNVKFLDSGGTGNYGDNQYITQTFIPATSNSKITVTFTSFDTEQGYDILRIYDGNSTYAPLIGEYSGNELPPVLTATNDIGQLTFLFSSSVSANKTGWEATISCIIPPDAPSNVTAVAISDTQISLNWSDVSTDETGFIVERSVAATSGFAQIATLAAGITSYANTGLETDTRYYYRVRAVRNGIYSAYSNTASAALGNAPILMSNGSFSVCNNLFMDAAGTGDYESNQSLTMTLSPATAGEMLHVYFSSFSTESCCDYLSVYDGASTSAPLIGSYSGFNLPPDIIATNSGGQLTFYFYSDGSVAGQGWQATVTCGSAEEPVLSTTYPVANSTNVAAHSKVALTFSEHMQAGTASEAAVQIHGSLSGSYTTSEGGNFSGTGTKEVFFEPLGGWKAGEVVTVSVTNKARSMAGLSITSPQVYQFTAAANSASAHFIASSVNLPANPFSVAMADFDKDGDIDMATTHNSWTGGVSISFNNGKGLFSGTTQMITGSNTRAIAAADFDNDGDVDLATSSERSSIISIQLNDGAGMFNSATEVEVGDQPYSMAAADFDSDGDIDLAAANYGENTVSIRFNNGAGVFSGSAQVTVRRNPVAVQAADFDNDGDMDLAVVNYNGASVSIRLNNGQGIFNGSVEVRPGTRPIGMVLADFDLDQDIDMAVASRGSRGMSVQLNDGTGVFNLAGEIPGGVMAESVATADFDGDGDMDVVMADPRANTLRIGLNNGQGTFSNTTQVAIDAAPFSIASADVDGDGDLDLVTANLIASYNSVLINRSPAETAAVGVQSSAAARLGNIQVQKAEIYPNPFDGELNLMVNSQLTEKLSIMIIDTFGKTVFENNDYTTNQLVALNPHLPAGIYTLRTSYGNSVKLYKIIKIK